MTARQGGAQAKGQHIYLKDRQDASVKRELVQVEGWTVQQATTGQATTNRTPDGRIRNIPAEDGVASVSIQLRLQTENPDHQALLSGESIALDFVQSEQVLEDVKSGGALTISTAGLVSFGSGTKPSAGAVGDAIQADSKNHVIVSIYNSGVATGDVDPFSKGDIADILGDNRVYVRSTLTTAVTSQTAFKIVRPETILSLVGTCQGPKLAGVPTDDNAFRVETIVFTPSSGLSFPTVSGLPAYS